MAPALQLPPLIVESRQASSPKPPNLAPLSSNTTDPSLKHLKLNGVGSTRNKIPQVRPFTVKQASRLRRTPPRDYPMKTPQTI
ncbi:hypothetical protein COLO4_21240 [Corchorus olitorius]|uniref:Uncharacterized protein n=1 Tax=Corchorus olitorius TaxID=93759 RepID=A0A1R3IUT0_9ROSI|nr:hypothetical protein COLO4_21240 [Corchorus olitorius]